jgi:gas vesicle protein
MAKAKHNGLKVGFGLAAVAAAAAGAYYFYGANGAKNRKQLKSWMVKAQGEVMEKIESLKDVSEEKYEDVVSQVLAKYKKVKNATPAEVEKYARELKSHWKSIKADIAKHAKKLK